MAQVSGDGFPPVPRQLLVCEVVDEIGATVPHRNVDCSATGSIFSIESVIHDAIASRRMAGIRRPGKGRGRKPCVRVVGVLIEGHSSVTPAVLMVVILSAWVRLR